MPDILNPETMAELEQLLHQNYYIEFINEILTDRVTELESFQAILRRITQADAWDFMVDLVSKYGIDEVIRHVKTSCGTDEEVCQFLTNSSVSNISIILKALPFYLEAFDIEGLLNEAMSSLFLSNPFHIAIQPPITTSSHRKKNTDGHKIFFKDQYLVKTNNYNCKLLDNLRLRCELDVGPLAEIWGRLFYLKSIGDDLGAKSTNIHTFKQIERYLLPAFPKLKIRTDGKWGDLKTTDYPLLKPFLVIKFDEKRCLLVINCNGNNDSIGRYLLNEIHSLVGVFDDTLRETFHCMLAARSKYTILRVGKVSILLKILVDQFFGDIQGFRDSKIVPHEFIIFDHRVDSLHTMINFILQAEADPDTKRLEEMKGYFKAQNSSSSEPEVYPELETGVLLSHSELMYPLSYFS